MIKKPTPKKTKKVIPKNVPIKSKVKKAIAKRAKKITKLPAYMTNKAALKHYRFALKYIELNLNATQAYLAVYSEEFELLHGRAMSEKAAATSAHRLLNTVKVQGYVKELIEELLLEDKTNVKTIFARYNRWADSDITDYVTWSKVEIKDDESGIVDTAIRPSPVNIESLTKEQKRNIKSISFTKDGFKLELVDKKGSNDQLAKLIGLDKEDKESEREIHIHFDKLDEQL